jgi:hypothetical protein
VVAALETLHVVNGTGQGVGTKRMMPPLLPGRAQNLCDV